MFQSMYSPTYLRVGPILAKSIFMCVCVREDAWIKTPNTAFQRRLNGNSHSSDCKGT